MIKIIQKNDLKQGFKNIVMDFVLKKPCYFNTL
jgi:hypothetical protein